MMFRVLVTFAVIVLASSASLPEYEGQAVIVSYENTNDGNGNYRFSYQTSNNIQRAETGTVVNAGLPDQHLVVDGFFSYIKPNGETEYVRYVADENGYRQPAQPYPYEYAQSAPSESA